MLGIGRIEIKEATYSLGMCGSIVFVVNDTEKKYKILHSMHEGKSIAEWDRNKQEWSKFKRVEWEDILKILPSPEWTQDRFIVAWAAFASGYEYGVAEEKYKK